MARGILDTSTLILLGRLQDSDALPAELLALFGGGDMSTPEGFYQLETFGMMAPIAVMILTLVMIGKNVDFARVPGAGDSASPHAVSGASRSSQRARSS